MADYTTRKQIAQDLDRAAARADVIDRTPATGKQCWFLAGLLDERGLTASDIDCGCTNTSAVLTKKRASGWIEELLRQQKQAA